MLVLLGEGGGKEQLEFHGLRAAGREDGIGPETVGKDRCPNNLKRLHATEQDA